MTATPETTARPFGTLCDYSEGFVIRAATEQEQTDSIESSMDDGGMGVILVDGERCYVED